VIYIQRIKSNLKLSTIMSNFNTTKYFYITNPRTIFVTLHHLISHYLSTITIGIQLQEQNHKLVDNSEEVM